MSGDVSLSEKTTEELVQELSRRLDFLVISGIKIRTRSESETFGHFVGEHNTCAGMCTGLIKHIWEDHDLEVIDTDG